MAKSPIDDESSDDHVDGDERPSDQELSENDSDDDNSDDNSDDGSSDDSDGGGLLDTMAAEGSEDESSEESSDEDELDRGVPSSTKAHFPQFCRLPIELRQRIWELFCPELRARHRVLDFSISYGTARHPDAASAFVWTVRDGIALDDQTRTLRTVLAVHHESRAMATNAFPHSLSMDAGAGDAVVRFNRDSDVVLINGLRSPEGNHVFHLPEFGSEIKNLALGGWSSLEQIDGTAVSNFLVKFDQLESFFVCLSFANCRKSRMAWCTSDLINRYHTQTFEREAGFGENLQWLYCWPDLRNHADFAKFQMQRDEDLDNLPEPLDGLLLRKGVKAWPMVVFEFERGLRRFEMLQTLGLNPDDSDSEGSDEQSEDEDGGDESGTDLDEYESDGIDDNEIVETYEDSDEEGISLDEGSPGPSRVDLDAASDDGSGAHFSSPEPDPEEPETAPVPRGRKRRVVSDSDDESDDDVQPAKRARTDRIDESEDDEDEEPVQSQGRGQRSARAVVSDDDDDEDDEDEEDGGAPKQEPVENADESDASSDGEDEENEESEDESEDEDEDEEDAPPARMSLAERLRLHRQENPIDEENSEDEDDRSSRTAGLDSEDEEDDDEDDRERNPFMFGMADESDGEGEGGYDEDDY
ncbi:2EXR domain-containing protein [Fusarium keratoplasticum]|uniref:2EXR domain-containing protein n=1 Tax=Fusarium keratoplasticum TaxID=1328300 RepID=A0ACC0QP45_9HYPO|nr:2EXR domain-containing protein [Fusarium keratoplasticum]KAI8661034.1 2EXR domain-containing protein [Fusarium keratoplasticum]